MKTQNGFTLMDKNEIGSYLAKQKVTRKITRLQVHNTFLPDYTTWEKTDKKVFSEPHFGRAQSLDDYGKKTWGYSDGHGHYTAQNFTVFPDGKIIVSRNLNSKPIGIKGWNDGALCIEIYGNFDKGKDIMNTSQKKAVIYLYGELCKRFKIPVDTAHIRPHCWFTAGGIYLGKYNSSRSAKTCPGTNFWGVGCSPSGFNKFLTDIKEYVNGKEAQASPTDDKFKQYIARVNTNGLNARKGPGIEYDIECILNKGVAITVVAEAKAKDGGTWCKCKAGYYVNKKYMEFVRFI
jgi:hypothetical protein